MSKEMSIPFLTKYHFDTYEAKAQEWINDNLRLTRPTFHCCICQREVALEKKCFSFDDMCVDCLETVKLQNNLGFYD